MTEVAGTYKWKATGLISDDPNNPVNPEGIANEMLAYIESEGWRCTDVKPID